MEFSLIMERIKNIDDEYLHKLVSKSSLMKLTSGKKQRFTIKNFSSYLNKILRFKFISMK